VNLFQARRVDRNDSAGFVDDVSDGEILTRDGAVFVVIRHPQVEIDEGAGVVVFRDYKPGRAGGRRYGPTAPEAYRVPAPVVVIPMRKTMRIPVRHGDRPFSNARISVDVDESVRATACSN
jgi:hypothetical protein